MPYGTPMEARARQVEALFAEARCPLFITRSSAHAQHGTWFKGLGWEFDTIRMVMICPLAKFERFQTLLQRWSGRSANEFLTLAEIKQAAGLMLCLLIGRASVEYVVHDRKRYT